VTVAFWLLFTLPEVTAKVALLWPDNTVTLAGTESNPLLLASETAAGLVVAVFNVTVHVLDALLPKVEGKQATELSCAGALPVAESVNVVDTLFSVAVRTAV